MDMNIDDLNAETEKILTEQPWLAAELPASAIVMETDAPDIPPHWLYTTAEARAQGQPQGRNEPGELPRIGAELAALRGVSAADWADLSTANALAALPRLRRLWGAGEHDR